MTQLLIVVFSMQEKTKEKGRDAKREVHKGVTAVPPKTRQIQTRASKSRKISSGRGEELSVREIRQRKERS